MSESLDLEPDFDKMDGLLPVVVQDDANDEVLMQAFMNSEAWELTLRTGKAHYYSRKKKRLWMKGEQSGHFQLVKQIRLDNDLDCVLLRVEQIGGAVEDGYRSCFYFRRVGSSWVTDGKKVFDPRSAYAQYSDELTLVLASGSLAPIVAELMTRAGLTIPSSPDEERWLLDPEVGLWAFTAPAQEIPALLQKGTADAGLTGQDMVADSEYDPTDVRDLGINKHGRGVVHWVAAVRADDERRFSAPFDFAQVRIRTQIPRAVRAAFAARGVTVEASPGPSGPSDIGDADAVVEISETGRSLRDRDLRATVAVLSSTVHLFAGNETWGYGWQRRRLLALADRLEAAAAELPTNAKETVLHPNL